MIEAIIFENQNTPKVILSENGQYLGRPFVVSIDGEQFKELKVQLFTNDKVLTQNNLRMLKDSLVKAGYDIPLTDVLLIENNEANEAVFKDPKNVVILGLSGGVNFADR